MWQLPVCRGDYEDIAQRGAAEPVVFVSDKVNGFAIVDKPSVSALWQSREQKKQMLLPSPCYKNIRSRERKVRAYRFQEVKGAG